MRWVDATKRALIAGGIVSVAALVAIAFVPAQPARWTEATITFIGAEPSGLKTYAPRATVVARTADGTTGRMTVPAHKLR